MLLGASVIISAMGCFIRGVYSKVNFKYPYVLQFISNPNWF